MILRRALLLRLCNLRYIPFGIAQAIPVDTGVVVPGQRMRLKVEWMLYPMDLDVANSGRIASGDVSLILTQSPSCSWCLVSISFSSNKWASTIFAVSDFCSLEGCAH